MTAPPRTTRVWLVEDNEAYRSAVARVVGGADGLSCPATFSTCEEALASVAAGDEPPDVILLDVGLPGMSGLEGIPRFVASIPGVRVIVLTVFEDDEKIFKALCAGATGYLLKMSPVGEVIGAIRDVVAGGSPMNARIARRVIEMFARLAPVPRDYGLTDREREVLELMVKGLIKKEIASRLTLSVHTVDSHIRNIYEKLHVHTRSGAVAKALKEKLL
ncbi:response regulator transcription factor [Fimbriiglobus ruber]|uniref:Response regulator LiaR n=1 Tax=Fimbriiglobus ruber TaxID=1908690 RepID=A0A225DNF8_9BACT|nr:response regulator transcription factor [Fimbriiglobus ruber]OWK43010.1 Response regulator LiaR [Fimbriiglobus ruber]